MISQEREQLTRFLQQLMQAQAVQKDGEADTLINKACLQQADAAYLLVQRAMLLDHALQDSRAQLASLHEEIEQLREQVRVGNSGSSFLDPNAWGNSAVTQPSSLPPVAVYAAAPAPVAAPAPLAAPAASAWGSGMLGNIATTAAGVVAGGFLFQGLGHLLGNQEAHAANAGALNGLSSNPSAEQSAAPASWQGDGGANNAGVFDTGSVDRFIEDASGSASDAGDFDDIV